MLSSPLVGARRLVLSIALCSAAIAPSIAHAQAKDPARLATVQALYDQAADAMDKGNFASACPKLEEVVRLEPAGIGAKLTLAECYEGLGKLASAWSMYRLAEEAAGAAGQAARQQKARARINALEPKLARLTIVVPETVRTIGGLEIKRDGIVVGPGQWGTALPVDKGKHVVVATAAGRQPWERAVEVPKDGASIVVTIAPPPKDAEAAPAPEAPLPAASDSGTYWGAQRTLGVVAGGLALVSGGVGIAFGVKALSKKNESADHCNADNRCDAQGLQIRKDGLAAGNVSTAFFVAGGVLLAGGVTLFLTAPKQKDTTPAVALTPNGLLVSGRF